MSEWVAKEFPPSDNARQWQDQYRDSVPVMHLGISEVTYVKELVAVYGQPDLVLEARPRDGEFKDGIPALAYVYFPRDGRQCYETFVVIMATGEVARFYCR
jgi:hypothetical protein